MTQLTPDEKPLEQLLLDPNNYRFLDDPDFVWADEARYHEESVQNRANQRLADSAGFDDLKNSILTNGFLPVERIVVKKYPHADDRYLVIEGNRRVAALRRIKRDHDAGVVIAPEVLEVLERVPAVVLEGDDPKLQAALMGVRHVSGIKDWGPYQRARLVTELRDDQGLDAGEVSGRLAMSVQEVNRRYKAYKALEQMGKHEEFEGSADPKLYDLFHELVSQPPLRDDWLGWKDGTASFENEAEAAKFFDLITPTEVDGGGTKPAKVTTSSEVRALKDIMTNAEAKVALFDPERALLDAIVIARQDEISRAWATQVAEAIAALEGIESREVKAFTSDDVATLQKLRDLVDETLADHAKLKS